MDDVQLLQASGRDPAAFAIFYDRWSVPIYGWFLRRSGSPEDATDLTAEAFAVALAAAPRFRGRHPASAPAWLFGIARNVYRDDARSRRATADARERLGTPRDDDGEFDEVDERVAAEQLAELLAEALAALPPEQRSALEARVLGEAPYGEAAATLGITEAHARVRVSRALRELARRLAIAAAVIFVLGAGLAVAGVDPLGVTGSGTVQFELGGEEVRGPVPPTMAFAGHDYVLSARAGIGSTADLTAPVEGSSPSGDNEEELERTVTDASGRVLSPPAGVAGWIACVAATARWHCAGVAADATLAYGTPLYVLESGEWVP